MLTQTKAMQPVVRTFHRQDSERSCTGTETQYKRINHVMKRAGKRKGSNSIVHKDADANYARVDPVIGRTRGF